MIVIKHVDHISMAVPDWKTQSVLMGQLFNFEFIREFSATPTPPFSGCVSKIPNSSLQWEILQPSSPQSFVAKFLNERGPGLHHITLEVPSINKAVEEMQQLELQPFGGISEDGVWKMTYIHPRDSGGVLWQLFEPLNQSRKQEETNTSKKSRSETGIDHVCLLSKDLNKQINWHKKIFGFQETENWEETALNIKGCRLKMPNSELYFEIISPMDKKGDVYDFIQLNGEGLHHIGLKNIAEGELSQHLKKLLDTDNKDDLKKLAGHSSYVSPQQVGGVTFYLSN